MQAIVPNPLSNARQIARACSTHTSTVTEMQKRNEAIDALIAAAEELGLYDDLPTVCVAHMRFIPCRHEGASTPCELSSNQTDVEAVRSYQQGSP
jgi:hypothetical protein